MTGNDSSALLARLCGMLEPHGLFVRGGVRFEDTAPVLANGRRIESLLLVGHAGSSLWPSFQRFRETYSGPDPLDHWSKQVIDPVARAIDGVALYPFDRPWWPFQQWVAAGEGLKPSPLGILIHPEFGLWHSYRAALAFDRPVEFAESRTVQHPCDTCDDRPCLTACPAGAIAESAFDVKRCRGYLATHEGQGSCMVTGCASRVACPVGRSYRYDPAHQQFLMQALDLPKAGG